MDRAQVEKISKALADQTRLKIFEAISSTRHMACGEIVSMCDVTPATVSHHLKILNEAGLIACRRQGQFVYSQAVPETHRGLHAGAHQDRAGQENFAAPLTLRRGWIESGPGSTPAARKWRPLNPKAGLALLFSSSSPFRNPFASSNLADSVPSVAHISFPLCLLPPGSI